MRKYILLSVSQLFFWVSVYSQEMEGIDSLQISKLKTELYAAKETKRIDILNKLAGEYQKAISSTDSIHRDSILIYATKAQVEATEIDYKYGIAYSLLHMSRYYRDILKDTIKSEEYSRQALKLANEINSPEILGWYYYDRWELKKALDYFQKADDKEAEADAAAQLCYEYSKSGKYDEEGFKYCQRAVELAGIKKQNTPSWGVYISGFTCILDKKK